MITLENISLQYDAIQVLNKFTISFKRNTITCILGPSGVGKTTIANVLAKLIIPDYGKLIGLENMLYSYVFHEPRLIQWYSVYDNIEFVLKDVYSTNEINGIVNKYISLVGLSDYKTFQPDSLSAGMAQRVSLARAFAYPSDLLIMDEPFKALDIKLKKELLSSFADLLLERKRTVVFISHDIKEAIDLADTIYIINKRPAEIIEVFKQVQNSNKELIEKKIKKIYLASNP